MTIELSKWPLLLVVGEPVTENQANEILVRTDNWFISTNDRNWCRDVYQLVGAPVAEHGLGDFAAVDKARRELGVLDLEHLANARIASAWIGGPKGWCDWTGEIGTSNYNIGKWPDADQVTGEWKLIAEAFPYLDLRAQLVPEEGEAGAAAIEWRVHDGQAEVVPPRPRLLRRPTDPGFGGMLRGGERGVSLQRLEVAIEQVRRAVAAR